MGQARNNYVIYVTVAFETYITVESACSLFSVLLKPYPTTTICKQRHHVTRSPFGRHVKLCSTLTEPTIRSQLHSAERRHE